MSIYKVSTPPVAGDNGSVIEVRYAPSEGAAKAFRRELMESHSLKMAEVFIETADIASGKAGIIAYLNGWHSQVPADYEPPGKPKKAAKKKAASSK